MRRYMFSSSPSPPSTAPSTHASALSGPCATQRAVQSILRHLRLGSVSVTCSVKPLEHINARHENAIASCTIVARDHPRIERVTEEDAASDDGSSSSSRRSRACAAVNPNAPGANDGDMVPLYARRKLKPPMRLDVRAGAELGQIEPAENAV